MSTLTPVSPLPMHHVRPQRTHVPTSRRAFIAKMMATEVNRARVAFNTRANNIRGAAFMELLTRLAECKRRKLGRKLTKAELDGLTAAMTGLMMSAKMTPRSLNVNKTTSGWLSRLC